MSFCSSEEEAGARKALAVVRGVWVHRGHEEALAMYSRFLAEIDRDSAVYAHALLEYAECLVDRIAFEREINLRRSLREAGEAPPSSASSAVHANSEFIPSHNYKNRKKHKHNSPEHRVFSPPPPAWRDEDLEIAWEALTNALAPLEITSDRPRLARLHSAMGNALLLNALPLPALSAFSTAEEFSSSPEEDEALLLSRARALLLIDPPAASPLWESAIDSAHARNASLAASAYASLKEEALEKHSRL